MVVHAASMLQTLAVAQVPVVAHSWHLRAWDQLSIKNATNEASGLGSSATEDVPVAPALLCVMVLIVFFFCVYLAVIGLRITRTCVSIATGRQLHAPVCEVLLGETANSLAVVPMLCILVISARLRAVQLGGPKGDPEHWIQSCMYGLITVFFLRLLIDVASVAVAELGRMQRDALPRRSLRACHCLLAVSLYAVCTAIFIGMLAMTNLDSQKSQLLPCTMICAAVIIITSLTEHMAVEIITAVSPSASKGSQEVRMNNDKVISQIYSDATISRQFPPMLCILLLGITLRAVQLQLKPPFWACESMCTATAVIVIQAAWRTCQSACQDKIHSYMATFMEVTNIVTTGCLYVSTFFILVSVFAMEVIPLSVIQPQEALQFLGAKDVPTISTTMGCMMLLTVVYFTVYLILIVAVDTCNPIRAWACSVLGGVQRSLAFAPMLCVMMISVRLRAMQLGLRDPDSWAQFAMYMASLAVIIQVACSLHPGTGDDEDIQTKQRADADIAGKVAVIALQVLRHAATMVLFVAMVMLVTSLVAMEPEVG